MVDWSKFKPEVFGSLPVSLQSNKNIWIWWITIVQVSVLCLMLVIVSISFPYWVTGVNMKKTFVTYLKYYMITQGEAVISVGGNVPDTSVSAVSFGLFEGRKTRNRGGSCLRNMKCNVINTDNCLNNVVNDVRGVRGRSVHDVMWIWCWP